MPTKNINSEEIGLSDPNAAIATQCKPDTSNRVLISDRKLQANRRNAKRSTGPRTPRGKANSRQNAIKHGLFVSSSMGFAVLGEDPLEYALLRQDLWDYYQPLGRAEELEVERISLCWWKHQRAWRHEDWAILRSRFSADDRIRKQEEQCAEANKEDQAIILELRNAKERLDSTGLLPDEIKQKLFVRKPVLEELWQFLSTRAELELGALDQKIRRLLTGQLRDRYLNLIVLECIVQLMEKIAETRPREMIKLAQAEHVVPNSETLDRLIRYEGTSDRNLSRSIDRLTRLQRQRRSPTKLTRP